MTYLTADEMRAADKRCIEELGIPAAVLMSNAGQSVFEQVDRSPVGLVCGKGNNGGDGFVVARLALMRGWSVYAVLIGKRDEMKGDAATFMKAYERLGGTIEEAPTEEKAADAVGGLADSAIIVDALLGTGISGEVHGAPRAAIEAWPEVRTVAVDMPSGLNADTGEPCGACVRCESTVTFQFPKKGFRNEASQEYTGRVVVADIGIPPVCADPEGFEALKATWRA
jgi:NAD(P)H-hydrate epimerase